MGTKAAPIYAALFLRNKEYLMTFLRFLDDIFLIWLGSIALKNYTNSSNL